MTRLHSAELFHGGAKVGQGANSPCIRWRPKPRASPPMISTGTSRTPPPRATPARHLRVVSAFMAGNSILGAAEEAERGEGDRPLVASSVYAAAHRGARSRDRLGAPNFCYGYMAQCIQVTVDVDTSHIRVDRVTSTHDVGKDQPALVRSQIEAVVQAHGYAMKDISSPTASRTCFSGIDSRHRRHSVAGRQPDPRARRSARPVRCPRRGRDAVHHVCAGAHCGGVRRHRRVVRHVPAHPERVLAGSGPRRNSAAVTPSLTSARRSRGTNSTETKWSPAGRGRTLRCLESMTISSRRTAPMTSIASRFPLSEPAGRGGLRDHRGRRRVRRHPADPFNLKIGCDNPDADYRNVGVALDTTTA